MNRIFISILVVLMLSCTLGMAEEGVSTIALVTPVPAAASPTPTKKPNPTVPPSTEAVREIAPYIANVKTSGSDLNIREKANQGATVLLKVANGTEITVYGTTGQWLKVASGGVTGFVPAKYVSEMVALAETPAPVPANGLNPGMASGPVTGGTAAGVNTFNPEQYDAVVNVGTGVAVMRTEPAETAPVKGQFYSGYPLKVLAEINGWCLVLDESYGQAGYVMKALLQRTNGMAAGPGDSALSTGNAPAEEMTAAPAEEAMEDIADEPSEEDGEEIGDQG